VLLPRRTVGTYIDGGGREAFGSGKVLPDYLGVPLPSASIISGNHLLDLLSESDNASLSALTDRIVLRAGDVLQLPSRPIECVYFPVCGVVSLAVVLEDGSEVSICGLGRDDAVHAAPDGDISNASFKVSVELDGIAYRVPAASLQQWIVGRPHARTLFSQHGELLLARIQQALACHMKHDVESRLCHWLLHMHEWQDASDIAMTHQMLARLLGVRRTTITLIAKALQDAGIISYRRGVIRVTDHYALHQASCECFRTIRRRHESFARRFTEQRDGAPFSLRP
jgi:CRP-like cAMP-binding protein